MMRQAIDPPNHPTLRPLTRRIFHYHTSRLTRSTHKSLYHHHTHTVIASTTPSLLLYHHMRIISSDIYRSLHAYTHPLQRITPHHHKRRNSSTAPATSQHQTATLLDSPRHRPTRSLHQNCSGPTHNRQPQLRSTARDQRMVH